MTDLRKAAEKVLQENKPHGEFLEALDELRQALAQPEQEPVAWLNITDEGERYIQFAGSVKDFNEGTKFYTAPPSFEAAVLAEREACAKLVESFEGPHRYVDDIAAAIRARSEK